MRHLANGYSHPRLISAPPEPPHLHSFGQRPEPRIRHGFLATNSFPGARTSVLPCSSLNTSAGVDSQIKTAMGLHMEAAGMFVTMVGLVVKHPLPMGHLARLICFLHFYWLPKRPLTICSHSLTRPSSIETLVSAASCATCASCPRLRAVSHASWSSRFTPWRCIGETNGVLRLDSVVAAIFQKNRMYVGILVIFSG